MPKPKHSPLPTEDLNAVEAWPFEDGCDEIVIRVSSYEKDLVTPASFQAIARGRDRTKVWGVGVRANPVAALHGCIESFFRPADEPAPTETETEPDIEDLLS